MGSRSSLRSARSLRRPTKSFSNSLCRAWRCFKSFCTVIAIPVCNLFSSVESRDEGLILEASKQRVSTFLRVFLLNKDGEYPISDKTCPGDSFFMKFVVPSSSDTAIIKKRHFCITISTLQSASVISNQYILSSYGNWTKQEIVDDYKLITFLMLLSNQFIHVAQQTPVNI